MDTVATSRIDELFTGYPFISVLPSVGSDAVGSRLDFSRFFEFKSVFLYRRSGNAELFRNSIVPFQRPVRIQQSPPNRMLLVLVRRSDAISFIRTETVPTGIVARTEPLVDKDRLMRFDAKVGEQSVKTVRENVDVEKLVVENDDSREAVTLLHRLGILLDDFFVRLDTRLNIRIDNDFLGIDVCFH